MPFLHICIHGVYNVALGACSIWASGATEAPDEV